MEKEAENLFLFQADEALGKSLTAIIPEEKRDEFHYLEKKVLKGEVV